jgi:hypothetical protein
MVRVRKGEFIAYNLKLGNNKHDRGCEPEPERDGDEAGA